MRNAESVLENETNKILWNFKIQTDHLIPDRRLDLVIVNEKKKLPNCRFYGLSELQKEKQGKLKKQTITLTLPGN